MKLKKWNYRKIMASGFAFIMIFNACSGVMEICAKELAKVQLADTYGKYYDQAVCSSALSLNKEEGTNIKKEVLRKEPEIANTQSAYKDSQEVVEKRTENTKTYDVGNGNYVQEIFFESVHKKEEEGYQEIDNTLVNKSNSRSLPIYENKDGMYHFKVQDYRMYMENESGESLVIINEEPNISIYSVKENAILYSEAYENIDMEYRLSGNAVNTYFYINGTTSVQELNYSITIGALQTEDKNEYLSFLNDRGTEVFRYVKPRLQDQNGAVMHSTFTYKQVGEKLDIHISMPNDWINSNDRIYPVMMQAKVEDTPLKLNVTSAYNRQLNPNTTSKYYDLFVGYEDGTLSGGYHFGAARTYIHTGAINIGDKKIIVDSKLRLMKMVGRAGQWPTIEISKTEGYVNPETVNWNNKPNNLTHVSTTDVSGEKGWREFDIKSYMEDIYKGKNNTIELKATNEGSGYLSNVFSNESGKQENMPHIVITYRDDYDVDPNIGVDLFDSEMRIYSKLNEGFKAFSFDGIAKPGYQVLFDLVEKGKQDVLKTETSKENVGFYFIDPIFVTNPLEGVQVYTKGDINYTTDYIYASALPQFGKPYEYRIKVKSSLETSTKQFITDSFIKYKVQLGDNLKSISWYIINDSFNSHLLIYLLLSINLL